MARSFSLPSGAPRRNRALTWLERGLAARALGALYKDDTVWDAISGDSRFGELLRRMGIQQ
jgi:hypothetical protein